MERYDVFAFGFVRFELSSGLYFSVAHFEIANLFAFSHVNILNIGANGGYLESSLRNMFEYVFRRIIRAMN